MFEFYGDGLSFPVLDVGVYESFVDGECGGWELVIIIIIFFNRWGLGYGISLFLCRLRSHKEIRLELWRVLAPLVLRVVCLG